MENAMFCFQCQETCKNQGCTMRGMCGKSSEAANRMDQLIELLKEIAWRVEASGQKPSPRLGRFLTRSLFITITNANFDPARLQQQIDEAAAERDKLPAAANMPEIPVGVLGTSEEDIRSWRELLTYGMKGIGAYADHAAILGVEEQAVYDFLIKGLAATVKPLSVDALAKLVIECGHVAVLAMAALDRANTSNYGRPEITTVKTGVGKRPGILISGHDLKDMAELLEQTLNSGVDIYTHGEMLPAHYYPAFKKYPHLVGNYGGSWFHQNTEFESFNGPILMTTNCIIPVRDSYQERIFTTGMAGYPGVRHIPDRQPGRQKDFSALIALAKRCQPPTELDDLEIVGGFAHDQVLALADRIIAAIQSGAIKRFIVMGGCDGRHKTREYFTEVAENLPKDTIILTAGCAKYRYNKLKLGEIDGIPRVLDAGQCNDSYSLAVIAMKLQEAFQLENLNQLPISFDLAWYEQKAVAVLLALLALGVKGIRLGPTLPAFLSPNAAKVLIEHFDLKLTGEARQDIAAMMSGQ